MISTESFFTSISAYCQYTYYSCLVFDQSDGITDIDYVFDMNSKFQPKLLKKRQILSNKTQNINNQNQPQVHLKITLLMQSMMALWVNVF